MKRMSRWVAVLLALALAITLFPATRAHASAQGRRNTAIAVTAATGYFVYRYAQKPKFGRLVPVVIGGAATYGAWHQAGKAAKREARRREAAAYARGHRTALRSRGR